MRRTSSLLAAGLAGRAPPPAAARGWMPASVLAVIHGPGEPAVILIEKDAGLRLHAGEISFPGGKPEPSDSDPLDTALREAREEIGLSLDRRRVLGCLDPVRTAGSGFVISPFVAAVPRLDAGALRASGEVGEIFDVPLAPLLAAEVEHRDPRARGAPAPAYSFGDRIVWGASARILGQMASMLGRRRAAGCPPRPCA